MKFLNNMTLGQYVPVESPVHHLDPRCKIVAVLFSLVGIFLVRGPLGFTMWGRLFPTLVATSKIPARLVLSTVKPVWILVAVTAAIHLFFTGGEPIFSWGRLTITRDGVVMASRMGLRLMLLIMFAGMLPLTTSPTELADGL